MNKEFKKHPILKILSHSDYDELIIEIHQSIRKRPICWMASEHLEFKFNGNKIHHTLWFKSTSSSIEFFNANTNEIMATIEFDSQLLKLPETQTGITLQTSL